MNMPLQSTAKMEKEDEVQLRRYKLDSNMIATFVCRRSCSATRYENQFMCICFVDCMNIIQIHEYIQVIANSGL
jgi:hypothetical protein